MYGIALDEQKDDDVITEVDNLKFTTTEDLKGQVSAVNIRMSNSIFGKRLSVTCH